MRRHSSCRRPPTAPLFFLPWERQHLVFALIPCSCRIKFIFAFFGCCDIHCSLHAPSFLFLFNSVASCLTMTVTVPVQENLRWACDGTVADRICNFNRHYAEYAGYWETTNFLVRLRNTSCFVSGTFLFFMSYPSFPPSPRVAVSSDEPPHKFYLKI